jgi:hypothetical protein
MARKINKLSACAVETLKAPGRYSDGGNLYLSISANGGRRWVFMYRRAGRQREMGLGSASRAGIPLAMARTLAAEARMTLAAGLDPLEARKARRQAARAMPSFGQCADTYIEAHSTHWRNDKHVAQWKMTLTTGPGSGKPLSAMAMAMQLRRMNAANITVHGFRSTFRDWASETTSSPHEVCEQALAHAIGNKTEAAYRRGDMFAKRQRLMQAWADFIEKGQGSNVTSEVEDDMATLHFICGKAGAGKTALARALGRTLPAVLVLRGRVAGHPRLRGQLARGVRGGRSEVPRPDRSPRR